jgi:O-acetyl-ADP-ribose deacetylase (regulator of RNase III)
MKLIREISLFSALLVMVLMSLTGSYSFGALVETTSGPMFGAILYDANGLHPSWRANHLAPRGSASITPSGLLKDNGTGINYILHAATGGLMDYDKSTEPTLSSVQSAIINSLRLAQYFELKKVAIPLIGGGLFLDRIHASSAQLAAAIMEAVKKANTQIPVVFVGYVENDEVLMSEAQKEARKLKWQEIVSNLWNDHSYYGSNSKFSESFKNSKVVKGNILDFRVHGADAIINPANMELTFGGGLSGAIAKATGEDLQINDLNHQLIEEIYRR